MLQIPSLRHQLCWCGISIVVDHFPVDSIPSSLQELLLTTNAPVSNPNMLPCVHTKHRDDLDTSIGALSRLTFWAMGTNTVRWLTVMKCLVALVISRCCCGVLGVHIGSLTAVVGGCVWGTGKVGCKDGVSVVIVLYKPHETRAKHGICSGDKFPLERLDRGEGVGERSFQGGGHWHRFARNAQAVEEKLVVVCH